MFQVVSFLVSVLELLLRLVLLPGQLLFVLLKFVLVVMLYLVAESLALLSLTVLFFREGSLLWILGYLALILVVRLWLKLLQAH